MGTKTHETVGRRFRGGPGTVYLVTRYTRAEGFWVRLIEGEDTFVGRKVGDVTCLSERAIGRTYHEILYTPVLTQEEHERPCECYLCREESDARSD